MINSLLWRRLKEVSFLMILILCMSTAHAQPPIKVACMGNSVTYGLGIVDREQNAYPVQLQQLLGEDYQVRNYGHSGATLLRQGHRPYAQTEEFAAALAYGPDIALIHLGLNDTDPRNWPDHGGNFLADYSWLIAQLRAVNPQMKIYIALLTPLYTEHPRFKSGTYEWHKEIRSEIRQVAQANEVELIDFFQPLIGRPDLFPDAIHPTAEGAKILAATAYSSLIVEGGGLQLPDFFSNGMLLQRGERIRINGKGTPSETVWLRMQGKEISVQVNQNGQWELFLTEIQPGGPFTMEVIHATDTIRMEEIWVGDLWLCLGQSNMDFPLSSSSSWQIEQAIEKSERLKLFKYNAIQPTDNRPWGDSTLMKVNDLSYFQGQWNSERETFSAVAYHFGTDLIKEMDIPIGLVQISLGGAPIEAFVDRESLWEDDLLVDLFDDWQNSDFIMPWVRERAAMNTGEGYEGQQRHPYQPSYIYEAAISNMTPFGIKGILWYQGESNTHNPTLYKRLFSTMVDSYRNRWANDSLPIYLVQLPGMARPSWPKFREMQLDLAQRDPYTEMAVTLDLGDSLEVHPKEKKQVGERLARLALAKTYHKPLPADAPVIDSIQVFPEELIVYFKFKEGLQTLDGGEVLGFILEDTRGQSLCVTGKIRNEQLHLPIPPHFELQKVTYGYEPYTKANLTNSSGMPMSTQHYSLKGSGHISQE